jgi:5'(3')-deoxyribonucleotidase
MRLLIDQDQVICDWVGRILEWYNEDKKTSFTKADITSWDVKMNLGEHSEDFLRSCMRYPEFYRDLEPVEGAIYGMRRLIDLGHDVVIATAIPKCAGIAYHGKLEWIRRNMPFFDLNNFVAIQRKYLLDADVLFDDGLHNIVPWAKKGWPHHAVILDCPWNAQRVEDEPEMGFVYRVSHWNQFIELLPQIEERNRKISENF